MLWRASLVIALTALPVFAQSATVVDLCELARAANSRSGMQPAAYERVLKLYRKYNDAGPSLSTGHLRTQFIQGLANIGRMQDKEAQARVIGKLIYFAMRLPKRIDEIDLLADILAYCPGAASGRFIYGYRVEFNHDPVPQKGDIYKTLQEGVYLGAPPTPWDEDSRVDVKEYEVAAWDERSIEDLKLAVGSRRGRFPI